MNQRIYELETEIRNVKNTSSTSTSKATQDYENKIRDLTGKNQELEAKIRSLNAVQSSSSTSIAEYESNIRKLTTRVNEL